MSHEENIGDIGDEHAQTLELEPAFHALGGVLGGEPDPNTRCARRRTSARPLINLYTFATAGFGLVAATFTRPTGQVGMLALLIVMRVVMLSRIRTSWKSMPAWLGRR